MIIQRIMIQGFGNLRDREFELSDGLNILYGENESGKTTIAEFVRAMLYGLDSAVRDIRENERLHYAPLDGSPMGGSMQIMHKGKSYLISRMFGKTRASDKLSVIDAITGAPIDCTPEELIGLDRDSFLKTLYIRQLSTKIEGTKNDEILKRLINLSQTGEEEASYQNAIGLLNDALKELTAKNKGIIPKLNDEIACLQAERLSVERASLKAKEIDGMLQSYKEEQNALHKALQEQSKETAFLEQYAKWEQEKNQAQLQEKLMKEQQENRRLQLEAQMNHEKIGQNTNMVLFLVSILLTVFSFLFLPLLIFIIPSVIFIVKYLKNKNKISLIMANEKEIDKDACNHKSDDVKYKKWFMQELGSDSFDQIPALIAQYSREFKQKHQVMNEQIVRLAEKIRDTENEKSKLAGRAVVAIDQDITMKTNQLKSYLSKESSIKTAMESLKYAFDELEQNFAPKLNLHTSTVLSHITDGRFTQVRADNIYHLTLTEQTGSIMKAEYVSTGCYDQIYFALRMGMIELLGVDAPIILDDALAFYDDKRLKRVMDYIKSLNRQVILFTCQTREQGGNMIYL